MHNNLRVDYAVLLGFMEITCSALTPGQRTRAGRAARVTQGSRPVDTAAFACGMLGRIVGGTTRARSRRADATCARAVSAIDGLGDGRSDGCDDDRDLLWSLGGHRTQDWRTLILHFSDSDRVGANGGTFGAPCRSVIRARTSALQHTQLINNKPLK